MWLASDLEKRLDEELIMEAEDLIGSEHEKVFKVRNHRFDHEAFRCDLEKLRPLISTRDQDGAVAQLKAMAARYYLTSIVHFASKTPFGLDLKMVTISSWRIFKDSKNRVFSLVICRSN